MRGWEDKSNAFLGNHRDGGEKDAPLLRDWVCDVIHSGPGWSGVHFFPGQRSEACLIAGVTSISVTYSDGTICSSAFLKSGHIRCPHSDPVFLGLTNLFDLATFLTELCPNNVQSFISYFR